MAICDAAAVANILSAHIESVADTLTEFQDHIYTVVSVHESHEFDCRDLSTLVMHVQIFIRHKNTISQMWKALIAGMDQDFAFKAHDAWKHCHLHWHWHVYLATICQVNAIALIKVPVEASPSKQKIADIWIATHQDDFKVETWKFKV